MTELSNNENEEQEKVNLSLIQIKELITGLKKEQDKICRIINYPTETATFKTNDFKFLINKSIQLYKEIKEEIKIIIKNNNIQEEHNNYFKCFNVCLLTIIINNVSDIDPIINIFHESLNSGFGNSEKLDQPNNSQQEIKQNEEYINSDLNKNPPLQLLKKEDEVQIQTVVLNSESNISTDNQNAPINQNAQQVINEKEALFDKFLMRSLMATVGGATITAFATPILIFCGVVTVAMLPYIALGLLGYIVLTFMISAMCHCSEDNHAEFEIV